jgi:hypothetical protein
VLLGGKKKKLQEALTCPIPSCFAHLRALRAAAEPLGRSGRSGNDLPRWRVREAASPEQLAAVDIASQDDG